MYGYKVNIYDVDPKDLNEFVEEVSNKIISNKSNGAIRLINSLAKAVENADLIIGFRKKN